MPKKPAATGRTTTARAARSAGARTDDAPTATKESKSARTRARILDAAANVLSRRGFAGTRLSEVAEQAELQAPAIYYYFPSREDLIEEVMWVGIAEMRAQLEERLGELDDGTPPMEKIMVAVESHLRHALEISDYATASIRNAGQLPDALRKRQLAEEVKYGEVWRRLLTDAVREGDLNPELDLYVAHMLVIGALSWAVEWWSPRRGSVDLIVANAQDFVRAGLRGHDAAAGSTETGAAEAG
ncbi:TetR/AcrR family transcriptional regulator [Nocardioides zeae]|uniref:TetR/AcrR family transcriptional regulator n=1 Tax=Nocardioides zeae TaxID=1457234 RepID=A0A6P0HG46_9ACTN|nr:TetR/AcrR family transcriptional regulator [Nocardioides zeae]NEN77608.1 TetR/AcrR family transcriptional regulator [Nocardioides zeae]